MKLLQHRLVQAALTALTLAVVPMAGAAQTCPDVSLTGQAIDQSAGGLAGGMAFPVVAGGPIDIGLCSDVPGTGFLAESPDFELNLSGMTGQDLQLSATAGCDSTLLVNDALGNWSFADDADGSSNPRLVLPAASDGTYDIWIGTFSADTCDASLGVQVFPAGTALPTDGGGDGGDEIGRAHV